MEFKVKLIREEEVTVKKIIFLGILTVLLTFGCVTPGPKYIWKIEPYSQRVENEYFSAIIATVYSSYKGWDGYGAFDLRIKNKSSVDIELDWNKTLYIENGKTNGGFMFEGIVYRDRNNPKHPDIIFAGSEFRKTIYPNNLVFFKGASWLHDIITSGQNGIYLTIRVKEKEINEKIVLNMSRVLLEETGRIGVKIRKNGVVEEVVDGGPASIAGIKIGDKLIKVDGEPTLSGDNELLSLVSKIAGEHGTVVELTIIRDGKELTFKVERKLLK